MRVMTKCLAFDPVPAILTKAAGLVPVPPPGSVASLKFAGIMPVRESGEIIAFPGFNRRGRRISRESRQTPCDERYGQ